MKRSSIVVLILIAGVTAMIWAGVMAYRIRKSLRTPPTIQATLAPEANGKSTGPTAAESDSPEAQGLPDLRGKQAPAFMLKTPDGKVLSLADYKGKAVLLNFWGTWCAPCKLELPWLIDLQKKYAAQGFTVLGVAENEDSAKNVADFAARMKVNYPLVMGDDKMDETYKCCDYVPTSYYIGRDGKILLEVGGIISESEMAANIQKILATKGA